MYVNDIKTTTLIVASNLLYGMIIPCYSERPDGRKKNLNGQFPADQT